jgi:hypothetical protein
LILVNNGLLMKHITIEIDGEKVVNESNFSPLDKKFQFDVGSSEKHHAEISAGELSANQNLC